MLELQNAAKKKQNFFWGKGYRQENEKYDVIKNFKFFFLKNEDHRNVP